jgi:SAM-dependent methyltransferase
MDSRTPILWLLPRRLRKFLRARLGPSARLLFDQHLRHSAVLDGRHIPAHGEEDHYIEPYVESRVDPESPDGLPIPPRELWWDYAPTVERYLEIGRQNIERMRSVLRDHGGDIRPGDRILDFGCAAAAQTRCLLDFARTGEVWGFDASGPHVNWCIHHMPTEFRFATTTMLPHLPIEDRYFDLIFAGSVFSHIGEMADAWLLELARITRPGGRLYLTLNTKQSMYAYLQHWPDADVSRRIRETLTEEEIKSNFATAVVGRDLWQHSVFDLRVFLRKCEMMCEVLGFVRNAYTYQTAVVLRRRETRRAEPLAAAVEVKPERVEAELL